MDGISFDLYKNWNYRRITLITSILKLTKVGLILNILKHYNIYGENLRFRSSRIILNKFQLAVT